MATEPCRYHTKASTTACGWLRAKLLKIDEVVMILMILVVRMTTLKECVQVGRLTRYESAVAVDVGER